MSEIQLLCQNDNSFIVENGDINANGDETKRLERTQINDTTKNGTSPLGRESQSIYDPPDGGWGWVVTFSAFIVGVILDGISFSFGLFFKELYIYFNESRSLTSWTISVLNGTYLSIGE